MTMNKDNATRPTAVIPPAGKIRVPISSSSAEPRIDVLKDGEIVTVIRVSCPCGQSIDIHCEYAE